MRDLDLSFNEPLAVIHRQSPRLPAPPRHPGFKEFIASLAALGTNWSKAAGRFAWRLPFAAFLLAAFVWASLQYGANLFSQGKPHPHPLSPASASARSADSGKPAVQSIDNVLATLALTDDALAKQSAALKTPREEKGSQLSLIQRELTRLGYYFGALDGKFGRRTETAIRAFERQAGLPPTGKPSEALLTLLLEASPRSQERASAAVAAGAGSSIIAAVQRRLADMAYFQGRPSGIYSPETRLAVARFQRDRGLDADGEIDAEFMQELGKVGGPLR